jgi:predicted alpha/beta superfamily hydrolase
MKRIAVVVLLSVIWLGTVLSQENNRGRAATNAAVEIPGSQLIKITSAIVEQEYDIYVQLPGNYSDTSKAFPVVYVLDGQWDFSLVTAIYGQQYYDGFVPAMIVVGITWGGTNPNYDMLRERDLTPTKAGPPLSGGGPKFLAFIKSELIPFIESNYRTTKNDRTLMGSSYGGLFTLYAMFHETALFQRYVLTSPALGFDNGVTFTYEKNHAANNRRLPAKLFMAIGEFEEASGFQSFVDRLKSRNHDGLQLQSRILEGVGHSGGKAEGYTRGLQAVFARASLVLDSRVLEQYVGVYQRPSGAKVTILTEGGRLVARTGGNSQLTFQAETGADFYVKGQRLLIHFRKDNTGKVTGFQLERYGGEEFVSKVN